MNSKYVLIIDDEECYIPESVIMFLGEDNFNMLSSDIDASKKYEILRKLDSLFSNYVTMSADSKYLQGRGMELSRFGYQVKIAVAKGDYDAANKALYKSIKMFYDIHLNCIKDEAEMRSHDAGMKV